MLGANLRVLAQKYPSISELSRKLGINRTQFNRYISGESFPRPDVLEKICTFFEVDARILLEPVEQLSPKSMILTGDLLSDFLGHGISDVPEALFPSGFYRFTRRSFVNDSQFIVGLVYVFRQGNNTFIRGYEAKEAIQAQGLTADSKTREFRGYVAQQEEGVAIVASRRKSMTCSFNYLSRVASFENNFWAGYVTRTVPESATGTRTTRLAYEFLGDKASDALSAARQQGFVTQEGLLPFQRRLLKINEAFR